MDNKLDPKKGRHRLPRTPLREPLVYLPTKERRSSLKKAKLSCPYLGLFQRNELKTKGGSKREESNGWPAQEIGENEKSHSLGDAGVVGVPRLGPSDGAVHFEVAAHEREERHSVDHHKKHNIRQTTGGFSLKWQANGKFAVIRYSHQG